MDSTFVFYKSGVSIWGQSVGASEWKVGLNKVWESKSSFCHAGIALPVPVALPQRVESSRIRLGTAAAAAALLPTTAAISTARTLSDLS